MGFRIREEQTRVARFLHLESGDGAAVVLSPSHGGTVVQVTLQGSGAPVALLAPDAPEDFARNPLFRGRLLFPWNDRIPLARYAFRGVEHRLVANAPDGSAIHGLIHDRPLAVTDLRADGEMAAVTLRASLSGDDPGYPFRVSLVVAYELRAGEFTTTFRVTNDGDCDAPFALGWHPYFAASVGATLQGAFGRFVEVDSALLPTGRVPDVRGGPFDFSDGAPFGPGLDIGLSAPADGCVRLHTGRCTVTIRQDVSLFPFTQLYVSDDGQSIAIEPITAATNSFNRPELGLQVLAPGEQKGGSVRISL